MNNCATLGRGGDANTTRYGRVHPVAALAQARAAWSKYTGYYSLRWRKWDKIAESEASGGNRAEDVGVFATEAGGPFKDVKVIQLTKP